MLGRFTLYLPQKVRKTGRQRLAMQVMCRSTTGQYDMQARVVEFSAFYQHRHANMTRHIICFALLLLASVWFADGVDTFLEPFDLGDVQLAPNTFQVTYYHCILQHWPIRQLHGLRDETHCSLKHSDPIALIRGSPDSEATIDPAFRRVAYRSLQCHNSLHNWPHKLICR